MTEMPDLSAGRDEELGTLLRAHLSAPDDADFALRMRAVAVTAAEDTVWRSVARWTLPGLAAAALLLAVLGAALGSGDTPAVARASGTTAGSLVELAGDSSTGGSGALLAVMTY